MLRRGENEQRTRLLLVSIFFASCTVVPACAQSPWAVFRIQIRTEMDPYYKGVQDPYYKGVQVSVCL